MTIFDNQNVFVKPKKFWIMRCNRLRHTQPVRFGRNESIHSDLKRLMSFLMGTRIGWYLVRYSRWYCIDAFRRLISIHAS